MSGLSKVLVTGAAGMLGTAILDRLAPSYRLVATDQEVGYRTDGIMWKPLNLLDGLGLRSLLLLEQPDAVIHCAAIVNVEACEKNPSTAWALHAYTTAIIAKTISDWGGRLLYISSDSVFNGLKQGPYSEKDKPDPLNVYARTKLEGELATLATPMGTVLRTNIFGWSRAERMSFAEWVIKGLIEHARLTMFNDVKYTPIHVSHLAEVLTRLLQTDLRGLYHAAGITALSKHDFALQLASSFGLDVESVVATSIEASSLEAIRPKNMALSSKKLIDALGYQMPGVDQGIRLLKEQYDKGWLARIKGRQVATEYRFWEEK